VRRRDTLVAILCTPVRGKVTHFTGTIQIHAAVGITFSVRHSQFEAKKYYEKTIKFSRK